MIPHFDKWPTQAEMLCNRVKKNQRRLGSWLKQSGVTCYRLYNHDIPEIPLLVDEYEGRLHVGVRIKGRVDEAAENEWVTFLVAALADALGVLQKDVFIKFRRQEKGGTQYAPVAAEGRIFTVSEGGHHFIVNLSDYLDTGLFLDHRITRKMVADESSGRRVLNLFAYTGSFSVYAAGGGATRTTTVDLSNTYLDAARANMAQNGFSGDAHQFVKQDVLKWLKEGNPADAYDLVVLDPPTTSKSKSMADTLLIQRDYHWMINAVLKNMPMGGIVYFSCNLSSFKFDAATIHAEACREITAMTIPPDFKGTTPHKCYRLVK